MLKMSSIILVGLMLCGCQSSSLAMPAATANLELGMGYLQQGDVERAKEKLLLAQSESPKNPQVYDGLGLFAEKTGDVKQAEQYYRQAVALAPHGGAFQNNLGTFLCRQKRYQEAIDHFERAVKDIRYLKPAEAYKNAAHCALKIPNKALAQQFFAKAGGYAYPKGS